MSVVPALRLLPLAGLLMAAPGMAAEPAWLLSAQRGIEQPDSPAAVRAQRIELQVDALRQGSVELELDLFGERVKAQTRSLDLRGEEDFSWNAILDGDAQYQVLLAYRDGHASGLVSARSGFFELIPDAEGTLLAAIDHSRFPPCGGAVPGFGFAPPPVPRVSGDPVRATRDQGESIDILMMYSPAARDAAGGVAQITAQAQAAADSANLSFTNSAMRMRFNVVGIELLGDWVEGVGNASQQLGNFRASATAQARRNALNADLVSLLVNALPSACGIGYVMRTTNVNFAPNGYQITARSCAVGNLSWAHEHGHNVGFEHDPANGTSPANASRPWSFGHFVDSGIRYRTVMSYECPAGGCTRRPYFSNPGVTFENAPTGIVNQRDNARTGNAVADTVANFRMVDFSFRDSFE